MAELAATAEAEEEEAKAKAEAEATAEADAAATTSRALDGGGSAPNGAARFGASPGTSTTDMLDAGNLQELTRLVDFISHRLPESALFDRRFAPDWIAADNTAGFFYTAIADKVALPVANKVSDTKTMAVLKKDMTDLLSPEGQLASEDEIAITSNTVARFLAKMSLVRYSRAKVQNIYDVLVEVKNKVDAGGFKHFQFFAYKSLITLSETPLAAIEGTIQAWENMANEVTKEALTGPLQGVSGLFEPVERAQKTLAAAAEEKPQKQEVGASAYGVPAIKLAFGKGSVHHKSKRARHVAPRFGYELPPRADKHYRDPVGRGGVEARFNLAEEIDPAQVEGYSAQLDARFRKIKADPSYKVLVKAVMIAFLHTPVTYNTLLTLIDKDVYFPFEFILFRPRITHAMATGILLKAGSERGETLVGHADFQLSDDVVRKMHYGNFTLYSKTIVKKSDNVYLAENIVATGYVGGNDTTFCASSLPCASRASSPRCAPTRPARRPRMQARKRW